MHYETQVLTSRSHEEFEIGWTTPQELLAAGYYQSTGLPVGQAEDYRRAMPDGRELHVRRYANGRWTAHWDHVDPSVDLGAHMVRDAPVAAVLLVAVGVALLAGWGIKSGVSA